MGYNPKKSLNVSITSIADQKTKRQRQNSNKTEIEDKKEEPVQEEVETPKKSDPEISAQLAKIDQLMDNNEAIMNATELEKVVAETTVVQEEKEIEEADTSNSKRRSSLKMRLSSVASTP